MGGLETCVGSLTVWKELCCHLYNIRVAGIGQGARALGHDSRMVFAQKLVREGGVTTMRGCS